MVKHTTKSPRGTFDLAKKFAARLGPGDVVALAGELGAGKTCFVQGLAMGLGVPKNLYVRSPSFTLMNEYDGGRLNLYHFDFYRLHAASELADLGLEEYFEGGGVTVVEWADRFPSAVPENAIRIEFKIVDENTREIKVVRTEV